MKIVEETDRYFVSEHLYKGMPIFVRQWKRLDVTEIKVTDYFARANGYLSVDDMAAKTVGKAKFQELFGGVPEWIRVTPDGEFSFVSMNKAILN